MSRPDIRRSGGRDTDRDGSQRTRMPADVDAPDKILYGLTFRQLAILAVAAAVFYTAWRALHHLVPTVVLLGAGGLLAALAAVLVVGRRDGLRSSTETVGDRGSGSTPDDRGVTRPPQERHGGRMLSGARGGDLATVGRADRSRGGRTWGEGPAPVEFSNTRLGLSWHAARRRARPNFTTSAALISRKRAVPSRPFVRPTSRLTSSELVSSTPSPGSSLRTNRRTIELLRV